MKWTELEEGKIYTDGMDLYKYEGIHAQTNISTVYEFKLLEPLYNEEGEMLNGCMESTEYYDSKRNVNFIRTLKEF